MLCGRCEAEDAVVRRCKNGVALCRQCFVDAFEEDVHLTIVQEGFFDNGDTVTIGVSGGKDSAVLLHTLYVLNKRHNYGLNLLMVAVDEGIVGYRDSSLKSVYRQQKRYALPLKVLSYRELFGLSMDEVVSRIGPKNNCTYCGVFRRQALERGSVLCNATKLATGHNADDTAETVLMNLLRGDLNRLHRCVRPISALGDGLPRCKPLYRCYEKEIVLYARIQVSNLAVTLTSCRLDLLSAYYLTLLSVRLSASGTETKSSVLYVELRSP
ncbi:unnamed protein product [Soboliphyme baturini]|uniref:ATP_bind_3 domain-containing protein n=1 Tax=Soboliphyme baturini TaxID=241478 RepID=A0A183IYS7_9BILA|nr:unnamed protein product [Soboliphyme baturini]